MTNAFIADPTTEERRRRLWLAIRRALLMIVKAIEAEFPKCQ